MIMKVAPLGAFGAMEFTVGADGNRLAVVARPGGRADPLGCDLGSEPRAAIAE